MDRVLIVNGPNLNLLGSRRPEVYGSTTLSELEGMCRVWARELGLDAECYQSNHEGAIIDRLHAARDDMDAIVINPGALTHSSYALHDALEAVELPAVEVHLSNVHEREEWRRRSVVRPACVYTIYGRGVEGYRWALRHLVARAAYEFETFSYGPHPDQVGDLRIPEGEGRNSTVVTIHGGFWRHHWTRDTMDLLAVDLTRRGFATWNVEYRRVGMGGGSRATVDDVAAAIDHLPRISSVDPKDLALVGHSAGGQLALVAGRSATNRPGLVVGLGAVCDLLSAREQALGEGAVDELVAGADPRPLSPRHLLPLGVPTLLAHGTGDDRVPVRQSLEYAKAAGDAGDRVELHLIEGGGHFEFLDPDVDAWRQVAERIEAALQP